MGSVEYQVLLNGRKTKEFKPSCGLRQGYSLLPYLFVLVMEKLSQLVNVCVDAAQWKTIRVSKEGSGISCVFC